MRVIRSEVLGMCFGVRDALEAMDAVADPADVTVHGELVHNEEVLSRLRERGFAMNPEAGRTSLPLGIERRHGNVRCKDQQFDPPCHLLSFS